MSDQTILFSLIIAPLFVHIGIPVGCFLLIVTAVLVFVVLYQRFTFKKGIRTKLIQISQKLEEISESGSDEKVMVFTDEPALMELAGEINRLLLDRQKVKAEFKRSEISSKKMLANISHDIKTPLTVILGYLEIMRLTGADDEMLKKVESKAKQVVDLINQFFTLAKLEAGDTNITLSRVNVSEICRESTLGFYEILLQKDFEVELSIPEKTVYVQGDKDALQRILFNLLSNAVRYGSDGKYLGIFLRDEKDSVWIDVTDKGKGIQREFADRIFERLYTMEDSRNREVQGNGLGLTIVKNLAIQLGGDIYLDSIPGTKTTFTVRLKKINY
ncbi:MAG: HAMP domain-containing histidine kinase [Dorea sp.]|nr:HAMP domain-containing histidine kinase [Dorea sp.]